MTRRIALIHSAFVQLAKKSATEQVNIFEAFFSLIGSSSFSGWK